MARVVRRELAWSLSIFLLCNLLLFAPAVFEHGAQAVPGRFGLDAGSQFALWRDFSRRALLDGRLPQWNPHLFAGGPFLAPLQAAVFYPPNLLLVWLPTPLAMLLGRLLHLLLGQLGAYLLVRRLGGEPPGALVAGVAFGLGSQFVDRIAAGHVCQLDAQAWMPWLVLAALTCLRGRVGLGVACGIAAAALQLTAGYPQVVQISWFALACLVPALAWAEGLDRGQALRRAGAFLILVPLGAAPLASATLLPAFELASLSARSGFDPQWVGMLSFPPENAITLLAPGFFGGPSEATYWGHGYSWETTLYVGAAALVMATYGCSGNRRKAMPWILTGVFVAFLSLGRHNPLFLPIAEHIPTMDLFRGNGKFVIPLTLCLAVLAGLGLPRAISGTGRGPLIALWAAGVVLVALFFSGDAGHAWSQWADRVATEGEHFRPAPSTALSWPGARASLIEGLAWTASALALLALTRAGLLSRRRASRALALLILIELLAYGQSRTTSFSMTRYEVDPNLVGALQSGEPGRVALLTAPANTAMAHGLDTLSGYEAVLSRRTNSFYNAWEGRPLDERRFVRVVSRADGVSRLLNQRTLVTPRGYRPEGDGLTHLGRIGDVEVWRDPLALPRAFLVDGAQVIPDRAALLARVVGPAFDPRAGVLLEAPPPPPPAAPAQPIGPPGPPSVRIVSHTPEEVRIGVRSPRAAFLVLTDTHYPGWTATVQGQPVPILPAYGLVRAVRVPAGVTEVVFRFDSRPVRLGLWISALALLVYLAGCLALARSARQVAPNLGSANSIAV